MKEKARPKEKGEKVEEPAESEVVIEESVAEQDLVVTEEPHTPKVKVEVETTQQSEVEIETSSDVEEEEKKQTTTVITEEFLPPWGNAEESEWMYGIPSREDDKELWAGEWADFLLEWAKHYSIHVLSIATFISEPPFKDLRNKVDSFKMIAQVLIDKEIAEYMDRRKKQLRVYWKPLEDWADAIYSWALKTGKLRLDVKSIVIQESGEDFATLPEKDLYIVLALMVEKKLAEWVDKNKGAIIVSV